jgi:predicted helicase
MTKAKIYYRDIGDYLSRDEKLEIVRKLGSVFNPEMNWVELTPNEHNDWINHRNDKFEEFVPLAPEKKFDPKSQTVFTTYSLGVSTNRDAWVYNYSKTKLAKQISRMIDFYNLQTKAYHEEKKSNQQLIIEDFIDTNPTKISWTRALRTKAKNGILVEKKNEFRFGSYRPFCIQEFYFDETFIESPGLSKILFPTSEIENLVICLSGIGANKEFTALISDKIPCLDMVEKGQCFPLYWYEETKQERTLFDSLSEPENEFYARRDAISDFALNQARKLYGNKTTKEDIFYYVYGFLHNPDYRAEFAADLKKMLPHIPFVGDSTVFWKYVKAGRELAQLHLHYEDYAHEAAGVTVLINNAVYDNFEVTKMRFISKEDKSTIIYNPFITITGIPAKAYEYVVNGRSAIEWIMESYQIKTHKESDIVNDPNDWAKEHNKPRYILDLLLSIIAVSMKTVEIVKGLPKVGF